MAEVPLRGRMSMPRVPEQCPQVRQPLGGWVGGGAIVRFLRLAAVWGEPGALASGSMAGRWDAALPCNRACLGRYPATCGGRP